MTRARTLPPERTTSRSPSAPAPAAAQAIVELAERVGNQGLQRMLARRDRPMLLRNPLTDAPKVAKALLGDVSDRGVAEALELLQIAERIPFYKPVLALALTGKVLNPEGLKIAVSELHAKTRKPKGKTTSPDDKTESVGMAHEILFALQLASNGVPVQMGGWKPDHLQKGMKTMASGNESLADYLESLAKVDVPLGVAWGGDTVVWDTGKDGKSLSVTTIQHKVLTSAAEESFGRELINAAQQLAGERQELALTKGRRVASLLITHPEHPVQSAKGAAIIELIVKGLKQGYGAQALNRFVDRVEVTTARTFFAFSIEGPKVTLVEERSSDVVAQLQGAAPGLSEAKPEAQRKDDSTVAAMEQKLYDSVVQARALYVKSQPNPQQELIDAEVSSVTGKKSAAEKREAMKSAIEKLAAKDKDGALLLEATLFVRCGWVLYGDVEKEARGAPGYALKFDEMKARLNQRKDEVNTTRRIELEKKWATGDSKGAAIIAAGESLEKARELLAQRRALPGRKELWDKLDDLRDTRRTEVALKLGLEPKQDADTASRLALEWAKTNDTKAKDIASLEKQLTAEYWTFQDDPQPVKDAIARIVRVEADPDYLGAVASAKAAADKRKRRDARTGLAKAEQEQHPELLAVLRDRAKLDDRERREIFATIGEIKDSEGNAREVKRIVDELTRALAIAWSAKPGTIDEPLLLETTKGLAKAGAGINYVGITAELNDLARLSAEPDRKGVMIGQWYALDRGKHGTWEEADTATRNKSQKDYSTEQEVDISFYEGTQLHIREVAANVEVLRDKLIDKSKLKQRTSYLKLKTDRGAKLTYVLDSERDWRKIFDFGNPRGKSRLPPMQAPMVKFLVDNQVMLVINGTVYDEKKLGEEALKIRPGATDGEGEND
jgi:hypothetical protein